MRNATFMFVCSIFCVILLSVIAQAQTSLTHDTGPLQFTVIDNGYIGDDATGTYGGVVFNGNVNAMYTAGFMGGNLGFGGTYGMIGSFTSGGTPVIQDYFNITPFSGFSSDPNFNQISSAEYGFTPNPGESSIIKNLSNTGQNFVFSRKVFSNNTGFDITNIFFGIFADWDVGGANYLLNRGGYDPGRNMLYQYENGGAVDPNYYGILPINEPPNTVKGTVDKDITFTTVEQLRLDIFYLMTSTDFTPITADGDYRTYLSTGPYVIPDGESLILDYAFVAGTNLADLQTNADLAIFYAQYVPVELTSFTAITQTGKVYLNWTTATELNNLGFEVERRILNNQNEGEWVRIGFVEGHGTTTEPKEYSYIDDINTIQASSLVYRLKQIDFLGSYEYSDEVYVENPAPIDYVLHQNYPNPFNPTTSIKYGVAVKSHIVIKVFNALGSEVAILVNKEKSAGTYEVEWNASNVPSGVYFYTIHAGDPSSSSGQGFMETKKMLLLK
jgi:hypothetical protein